MAVAHCGQSQGFSVAPNRTSQTANSHLLVVFWAVGLGHQEKSFQPEDWLSERRQVVLPLPAGRAWKRQLVSELRLLLSWK